MYSQASQYIEAMQRALDVKGVVYGPIGDTQQPGITVLDLTTPEFSWLRRARRYMMSCQVAAGVAQGAAFQLSNPAGSNVIAKVMFMPFSIAAASDWLVWIDGFSLGLASQLARTMCVDSRQESTTFPLSIAAPGCPPSAGAVAVAGPGATNGPFLRATTAPNVFWDWVNPIVLSPGKNLSVQAQLVNTTAGGGFFWEERALEASEL